MEVVDQKTKSRTPDSTNGIRTNGKASTSSAAKVNRISATKSMSTSLGAAGKTTMSTITSTTIKKATTVTGTTTRNTLTETLETGSSLGNGSTSNTTAALAKKGKSVRIATITPAFGRPTRASVLCQKALAKAKNPVKERSKTAPSRVYMTTTVSHASKSSSSTKSKSSPSLNQRISTVLLNVPGVLSPQTRGRGTIKQTGSTPSSRASSISSVRSTKSPSVSPSQFGGVH